MGRQASPLTNAKYDTRATTDSCGLPLGTSLQGPQHLVQVTSENELPSSATALGGLPSGNELTGSIIAWNGPKESIGSLTI